MTEPAGADVYFKDYADADGAWATRRTRSRSRTHACLGQLRWRIVKDGFDIGRGVVANRAVHHHSSSRERRPRGWCTCAAEHFREGTTRVQLPDFWIDKYEVTNREFKRFADAGGYGNRQYWKEPFVIDGVKPFVRGRGRAVHGQDRPAGSRHLGARHVSRRAGGLSGGRRQLVRSVGVCRVRREATPDGLSLEAGDGECPVRPGGRVHARISTAGASEPPARLKDLGTYGTYGLAGNVKEWIWNETDGRRYVVGGAWNDPPYMAPGTARRDRPSIETRPTVFAAFETPRRCRPMRPAAIAAALWDADRQARRR